MSDERVFNLEAIDSSKKSYGLIDIKKNRIIAYQEGALWLVRLDHGAVPEPLRQRFTSFEKLRRHVTNYLSTRNIKVVGILN
jgi:hypothetical protein